MGIMTVPHPPNTPDLAPCDFWLFPKLRGSHYGTIEEMKEDVTRVIDTLAQEDFHGAFQKLLGTVQQGHFSRRRLLRRGLEFHVCTINKMCPYEKKSLETNLMILVYIYYIYIYSVCVCVCVCVSVCVCVCVCVCVQAQITKSDKVIK